MKHGAGLDLKPEYHALARMLAGALLHDHPGLRTRRTVIGVAGESGSGKSITATCLAHALEATGLRTAILHQDNYFLRPPRTNHEYRLLDLAHVGPHEVDLARIGEHIAAFRAGRDGVTGPAVNYPENRFDTQPLDFGGTDVLLVEGTYVLTIPDLDVRVFLDATHEDTHERRKARNRDIDAPVIRDILAIEHRLIAPQRDVADYVIDRQFALSRAR